MKDIHPKKRLRNCLRRLAGQVNGIDRMLKDERDFEEIMIQLKAAQAALKSLYEKKFYTWLATELLKRLNELSRPGSLSPPEAETLDAIRQQLATAPPETLQQWLKWLRKFG